MSSPILPLSAENEGRQDSGKEAQDHPNKE